MDLITRAPKGTRDSLPEESKKRRIIEDVARRVASSYGYGEIRTPVFEHSCLFERSAGSESDIVQKEMYKFVDKGGRYMTLRPEGTAPVARAILEHGLHNEILPLKLYYFSSCYRYERPQSGRLREFNQFGLELFGTKEAQADAEIIALASNIFNCLGIEDLILEINSIGCGNCRPQYIKDLKEYFSKNSDNICNLCKHRLDKNPLRILDCKNESCIEISQNAPKILDYLCDDCREHFSKLRQFLDMIGIKYTVNPYIVRGLDYYTKTVFEFIDKDRNTQNTVCGGGRYDNLIKEISSALDIPALGFGIGIERLLDVIDRKNPDFAKDMKQQCDLFIAAIGDSALKEAFKLAEMLRSASLHVECDLKSCSLRSQLKYADKLSAEFSMVLGEDEILKSEANVKNMKNGETKKLKLGPNFITDFMQMKMF